MVKKNKICLAVSTCDRQTDGQIDILRLAVSAVSQCGLASGCELVKRRSAPTYTMRALEACSRYTNPHLLHYEDLALIVYYRTYKVHLQVGVVIAAIA